MEYAILWLLAMLFISLLGSFYLSTEGDLFSSTNYKYEGYKYLNREI